MAMPFVCDQCEVNCRGITEFVVHLRTHTSERPFVCTVCGKAFTTQTYRNVHFRSAHGDSDAPERRFYQCMYCDKRWHCASHLLVHERTVHFGMRPFSCPDCGQRFRQRRPMTTHRRMVHDGKKFTCDYCGLSSVSMNALQIHVLLLHLGVPHDFECTSCGKHFRLSSELRSHHRRMHTGDRRHQCRQCDRRFANTTKLKYHEQWWHLTEKTPDECHECGQRFRKRRELWLHVMSHLQKQTFQCSDCDQRFSYKTAIAYHIRGAHTRTTEVYRCPRCQKRLFKPECLSNHLRRSPEYCEYCKKCFSARARTRHERCHGENGKRKPLECYQCGMKTFKSRTLYLHLHMHSTRSRALCFLCNSTFRNKHGITLHIKKKRCR